MARADASPGASASARSRLRRASSYRPRPNSAWPMPACGRAFPGVGFQRGAIVAERFVQPLLLSQGFRQILEDDRMARAERQGGAEPFFRLVEPAHPYERDTGVGAGLHVVRLLLHGGAGRGQRFLPGVPRRAGPCSRFCCAPRAVGLCATMWVKKVTSSR